MNDPVDLQMLAALARQLGEVSGALTRPAVRAGLAELLRQPEGAFSRSAVGQAYRSLGEVLDEVYKEIP